MESLRIWDAQRYMDKKSEFVARTQLLSYLPLPMPHSSNLLTLHLVLLSPLTPNHEPGSPLSSNS